MQVNFRNIWKRKSLDSKQDGNSFISKRQGKAIILRVNKKAMNIISVSGLSMRMQCVNIRSCSDKIYFYLINWFFFKIAQNASLLNKHLSNRRRKKGRIWVKGKWCGWGGKEIKIKMVNNIIGIIAGEQTKLNL